MEHQSETELILLARTDKAAFAQLYERSVDKVYTYVYYRTGNQALTEDIVSATFLKALEHIGTFRPKGGGFMAWLLRIARNQAFDHHRKNKRLTVLTEGSEEQADGTTPEFLAIQGEEAEHLHKAVHALPDAQREVILLKYTLELKNKEIAHITGKSETAVSSLLHRAIQTLRKEVSTNGS